MPRLVHDRRARARGALLALGILPIAGCRQAAADASPARAPADVGVVTVVPRTVEEPIEYVGEVQAARSVQVRAQVAGVITARPFREGEAVRAGQVLYRIDPTTYDADYRGALARLAQAEAQRANARTTAGRLAPLLADNAVARQDVDNANAAFMQAEAAVADARASVDAARKRLSDAVVRAEIAGRVGRARLDVGTRVTGPSDVLTTVDVVDSVHVSFRPAADAQLRWRRDPALRRVVAPGGTARVDVILADGQSLGTLGTISYVDPVVDPATGTQEFRATFRDTARLLVPGQFVRVRLRGLERRNALVVPQRAVVERLGRQTLYVVGRGDTVVSREVRGAGWSGGDWLIESGLSPGERVVVDGLQKVQPGAPVRPRPLAGDGHSDAVDAAATQRVTP